MRLVRLIANLGYGSQKEVRAMIRDGRLTDSAGAPLSMDSRIDHSAIRLDGEGLDPAAGMVLMLNKPINYTCSSTDPGRVIYELLPERFGRRHPVLAPVGRLDRDSTGLLLMTDDGALLHRITAPRSHVAKTYDVTLARPLDGGEAAIFASGTLMLRSETTPLAPATMVALGEKQARLTIVEGRYHQIKRMFAALGNHVESLHRRAVGGLTLGDLAPGRWRILSSAEVMGILESEGG
jgi:16S rRNA pseudouridine516 synthase